LELAKALEERRDVDALSARARGGDRPAAEALERLFAAEREEERERQRRAEYGFDHYTENWV
jgi:hypothetical protein